MQRPGVRFVLSVLSVLSVLAAGALAVSCAAPPPDLAFPGARGWSSVTVFSNEGVRELAVEKRFVSSGRKFRLEVTASGGAGLIAVYDGDRLVTTSSKKDLRADDLDPRVRYREVYATLPEYRYVGGDRVEGRRCWRFAATRNGVRHELWIDAETRLPRRNYLRREDAVVDEQFFDLPEDFEVTPALFDADVLEDRLREAGIDAAEHSDVRLSGPGAAPQGVLDSPLRAR